MRGRLGCGKRSDAWQPIATTSTALLSTNAIQGNRSPHIPTASSLLVPLRNADRVNSSTAANCKLSSWGRREQLDAREPPNCVQ
ncbi:hypothetical protein C2E31_20580 [Rhodopirellula baltica]|nr:hypothetical protein C2E31_20580 [Rhodopirellula baltica]